MTFFIKQVNTIKISVRKPSYKTLFFILLFFLFIIKNFVCGIKYFPVLDDYIQYSTYKLFDNVFQDVLIDIGTVYTRPLAGIFDVYVWSLFWDKMYVALFIISILQFLSAYFISASFEETDIHFSKFFVLFYLFCPLNIESVYWISASSRICVGVFFCALSLFVISKKITKTNTVLFYVFNLFSYLFYEQCLIFSFVLSVFFLVYKNKRLVLIPVLNLILTAVYYVLFSGKGAFSNRNELGFKLLPIIYSNIKIFSEVFYKMIVNAKFILLFIPLCIAFYFVFKRFNCNKKVNTRKSIFLAVLIFLLPYAPFVFLKNSYISLRNVIFALIATGMILDNINIPKKISHITFCLILSVFLLSSANEVMQYKKVHEIDKTICENIINSKLIQDNKTYYLVGAKPLYTDISVYFNEHIHNVTQSNWALTGALRAYSKNLNIKNVIPVQYEYEAKNNFEKIYIDEKLNISK